jgi:alpha-D-xyloside xylohydrolase
VEATAHPGGRLLLEFPDDQGSWAIDDEFVFGRDLLVAPVLEHGARERRVYLPSGADWADAWTDAPMPSGEVIVAPTPMEAIPVSLRDGAQLPVVVPAGQCPGRNC